MSERKILNVREGGGGGGGESLESIGIKLQRNMLEIKGLYLASDGKGVDYDKIKDSPEFSNYTQLACSLTQTDLKIASEEERKSFFISEWYIYSRKGGAWGNLKENKKKQNLHNQRGHAHQNWFPCISRQPLFA